jgi:hypothetical protein
MIIYCHQTLFWVSDIQEVVLALMYTTRASARGPCFRDLNL